MQKYQRQTMLKEIGISGQQKLQNAKVLIVGLGGLGSPISTYLTGAGVGTIGLLDNDTVSLTNIHRQVLYSQNDVGQPKVEMAYKRLSALNSDVKFLKFPLRLSAENARSIISQFDIVVDACDNFETRYIIDEVCAELNKPYIFGAISEFQGQVSVFNYTKKLRYKDVFPIEDMPSADSISKAVIGPTASLIASVQCAEVFKIICGFGQVLESKLWTYNLLDNQLIVFDL